MTTCDTDVVQVIESHAELGADKWIGGRIEFSSDAVGLEAEDTSSHIVNIISPTSHHRVSLD
jgi:hypothetical protein